MIKKFFTICIALILSTKIIAQDNTISSYEFGMRISPQISSVGIDSKSIHDNGVSLDWNFGFVVTKNLNERYSFGTELNVLYTTAKIKHDELWVIKNTDSGFSNLTYNYSMRYFQLPIIFKMRSNEIKEKFRLYGEFGFAASFLFRSKADVSSSNVFTSISNMDVDNPEDVDKFSIKTDASSTNDLSDDISLIRTSLIVGGGIEYTAFGSTKMYAGLRYDGGMSDMLKEDKWTATNSFTSINIGLIF